MGGVGRALLKQALTLFRGGKGALIKALQYFSFQFSVFLFGKLMGTKTDGKISLSHQMPKHETKNMFLTLSKIKTVRY